MILGLEVLRLYLIFNNYLAKYIPHPKYYDETKNKVSMLDPDTEFPREKKFFRDLILSLLYYILYRINFFGRINIKVRKYQDSVERKLKNY